MLVNERSVKQTIKADWWEEKEIPHSARNSKKKQSVSWLTPEARQVLTFPRPLECWMGYRWGGNGCNIFLKNDSRGEGESRRTDRRQNNKMKKWRECTCGRGVAGTIKGRGSFTVSFSCSFPVLSDSEPLGLREKMRATALGYKDLTWSFKGQRGHICGFVQEASPVMSSQ